MSLTIRCKRCATTLTAEHLILTISRPDREEAYRFCSIKCLLEFLGKPVSEQAKEQAQAEPKPPIMPANQLKHKPLEYVLPHPKQETSNLFNWLEGKLKEYKDQNKIQEWTTALFEDGIHFYVYPGEGWKEDDKKTVEGWFKWIQNKLK